MIEDLLKIEQIQHVYPETGWELDLKEIRIRSGQIIGVIGPNGSGKSTLMRIGAGVLHPTHGRVELRKKDIRKMNRQDIARELGYLPQELTSLYDLTVKELVSLGRYPHTRAFSPWTSKDKQAVRHSLSVTEMKDKENSLLSHLSGGEKKRAFLASVLAQEPELMLLDEPTSALDVHHQVQFFSLLKKLSSDGMAVVAATHDLNLASLYSDQILVLDKGRIAASGPPREVLTEDLVRSVYGQNLLIGKHPEAGLPTFLPRIKESKNS